MIKRWRSFSFGILCAVFLFLGVFVPSAQAIDPGTFNLLTTPFYDPSAVDCVGGNITAKTINARAVAQQYNLQSVGIEKIDGTKIDSYQADKPPIALASVFKLIISDVFLSTKPDLTQSVKVKASELYQAPGAGTLADPKAGDSLTLKQALEMTLMQSSNTDANVLIDAAGGLDSANKIAGQLGYASTTFKSLYTYKDVKPGYPGNISTAADLTKAMENIFIQTSDSYQIAQNALENDEYDFGLNSIANKWGGTSQVTGNSALFKIAGDRYVITMYTENPWADNLAGGAGGVTPSASVGYIRDATNSIVNTLKTSLVNPGDQNTCPSSNCSSTSSSLDAFLKAVAYHESAGDYGAYNAKGGAYGRYQYIDQTWRGALQSYTPLGANQYPHASDPPTPGPIQDMVTYFRFAAMATKFNGSVFKMAVEQYYPAALSDPSLMDQIPDPQAGNTITPRQFGNLIVSWVLNGDGKDVGLQYSQAPNFDAYLKKDGLTNIPQLYASKNDTSTTPNVNSGDVTASCAGAQGIVQTAINFSWPDSSHGTTPKPEYQQAIDQYNKGENPADCGVFVATVMRASGADPKYPAVGTASQASYVANNPKYDVQTGVTSTAALKPGDILIINSGSGGGASGHTFIWLGQHKGYNEASASLNQRAANLGIMDSLSDPRGTYERARLLR